MLFHDHLSGKTEMNGLTGRTFLNKSMNVLSSLFMDRRKTR